MVITVISSGGNEVTKCILSSKLKTLTFFHLFHYRRADCKSWNGNCIICKLRTQHIATSIKIRDLAEYRINDMEMPLQNANPVFVLLNQIIVSWARVHLLLLVVVAG